MIPIPRYTRTPAARTQQMGMNDFEDALQIAAAERCGADVIVTRNIADFAGKTAVRVVLPEDFVDQPPARVAGASPR